MINFKHYAMLTVPFTAIVLSGACSSTSSQNDQQQNEDDYALVNMKQDTDQNNRSADKSARYSVDQNDTESPSGDNRDSASPSGYTSDRTSVDTNTTEAEENRYTRSNQLEGATRPVNMTVYFDVDSSEVKDDAMEKLESLEIPNDPKLKVSVRGHTDATGSDDYNKQLSEKRAKAVENEIDQQLRGQEITWEVEGHGEEQPESSNDSEWGRQQNRRVEVTVEMVDQDSDQVGSL